MNNFQKLINTLGIEPNIALAVLVLLSIFLVVITILYICVPFFLLRIRKEIIELNRNLRSFFVMQTQTKINGNSEFVSNKNKDIYDEKSPKDIKKFQLDDEDIKKLTTHGFDVE